MDDTTGELVLRIRGSARDGQIVRLRSPKCTIGSGPQCTLRLRSPEVQPIHCLILRGPAGSVVRRWSADTRLNGQAFSDAPLTPGDRLGIGTLEFEVLASGNPVDRAEPRQQARLEVQLQQTHLIQQREELQARLAELEAQRQSLDEERQRWEAARVDDEERLQERSEQLDRRQSELDTREADLVSRPSGGQSESATSTEAREDGQEIRFETPAAEAPTSSEDIFRRLGTTPLLPDEEEETVSSIQADTPISQSTPDPSTLSKPQREDEQTVDQYMARLLERVRSAQGEETGQSPPPPESMVDQTRSTDDKASEPEPEPEPTVMEEPLPPADRTRQMEPADLSPRAAATERTIDLSALREVANVSAQTAIACHADRRFVDAVRGKFWVASVCLASSIGLLWLWWTGTRENITYYTALLSFILAVYWGGQYVLMNAYRLIRRTLLGVIRITRSKASKREDGS